MFSRVFIALALVASLVAPSVVADQYENLSARELQDVAAHFHRRAAIAEVLESIEGKPTNYLNSLTSSSPPSFLTARSPRVMTTRYCSGANIMEKKTDEHGKVISNSVYETCHKPSTCVEYGNGRVKCGKA